MPTDNNKDKSTRWVEVGMYIQPKNKQATQKAKNRFFFSFLSLPFVGEGAYDDGEELTDSELAVYEGSGPDRPKLRALKLFPIGGAFGAGFCCCGGGASRVKYRSS